MVAKTDENEERQRRMLQARRVFILAAKSTIETDMATTVETASAMMSVAIMIAFAAQGCDRDEVDPVNACSAEVTDVICRHVGEWLARKQAGAAAQQAGGDHGG